MSMVEPARAVLAAAVMLAPMLLDCSAAVMRHRHCVCSAMPAASKHSLLACAVQVVRSAFVSGFGTAHIALPPRARRHSTEV